MQLYPNGMWPSDLRKYWTNIILGKLKERVPSMWLRGSHHPAGYELVNALESPTLLPVTPHPHFMCKGNQVSASSEWTLVESYFGLLSGLYVCVCVCGCHQISPGMELLQRLSGASTVPETGSTGTEAEHLWEIAVPCSSGWDNKSPAPNQLDSNTYRELSVAISIWAGAARDSALQ